MQVGRTKYATTLEVSSSLSDKEVRMLSEIGLDEISTATSFVEYVCDKYSMSRSGAWYCLKKLKKEGVVEFTEKGEAFKPLRMTEKGLGVFRAQVYDTRNDRQLPALGVDAAF